MAHRVTFIPGDGIGPEVAWAARRCLEATGVAFEWDEKPAGEAAIKRVIWAFDQDAWARSLDYSTRPMGLSRDLYLASRAGVIHYAAFHYVENGHLEWIHSETGVRTLRDEFDKVVRHNEDHVKQIRIALDRQIPSQT